MSIPKQLLPGAITPLCDDCLPKVPAPAPLQCRRCSVVIKAKPWLTFAAKGWKTLLNASQRLRSQRHSTETYGYDWVWLFLEEQCWFLGLSHVTGNIELFGWLVVWLFTHLCYMMLNFWSSFWTHFLRLQVVLSSERDLVPISFLTQGYVNSSSQQTHSAGG